MDDVPLEDITGTYRWVWEEHGGTEWTYHELDDMKRGSKLQIESMEPGSTEPSKLKGRFDMASWHMGFTGLKRGVESKHEYEILKADREDIYTKESLDEEGNCISVLPVKDDDGYPFVMFE